MIYRGFNLFRAVYSFLVSSLTGKVTGRWMPVFAGVELTNHCNLNCPECITGSGKMTRPKGNMSAELFEKIIQQAGPYLYNMNLFFQGEPMMNPEFFLFLQKSAGYNTIVSTNGQFLTVEKAEKLAASGLRKLIVSLDGMDEPAYILYRQNGDFQKVVEGIKNVASAIKRSGSPLKLEIQFLVNRHNESQIAAARKFASEVNAKLRLKSMQVLDEERAGKWLPSQESFRRYRGENGSFTIKSRLSNRCLRLWLNPVITWDGKVIPCCFDKNADHILGDLNTQSFSEIWHGKKALQFRQSLFDNRSSIEICRNCTTGLKGVKY
jgi:radical SAM protein with 4Fe4S-binding SPASM domain